MTCRSSDNSWSWLLLAALSLPVGCAGDGPKEGAGGKGKASAGANGKADGGKADGGKAAADGKAADDGKAAADGKAADDGKAAADAGPPADDGKAAADSAAGTGAPADGGKAGTSGAPAAADGADDESGAAEAGAEAGEPAVDAKALLKEVAKKRTKDDRANEALAAAEAAGSTPKELARAAHKRGKALHATPDRAKVFFEYARDKDPKYPDPSFELAKQSVNLGELKDAISHLTEVKKRKGKKLLSQIDFDPMWDVIKDDPDVRQLVEG